MTVHSNYQKEDLATILHVMRTSFYVNWEKEILRGEVNPRDHSCADKLPPI
jgi:DNA-binding XRE family transcriptional regulator